jgi:hypothetical protein
MLTFQMTRRAVGSIPQVGSATDRGGEMELCGKEEKKKKNEIFAKNTNVTKTTQQSSIDFLYHSTALLFGVIWSFSPK